MAEPLIAARRLVCGYDAERPILREAEFTLRAEQRIGLTGANGNGKSTFLHALVGLVPIQSGDLEMFGEVRTSPLDFGDVRRRVGLLFQDTDDQLFCPTVLEDVAFGPLNLGKPTEEARSLATATLERVGLNGYEERIIHKLSGGEQRLVALAGVLAMSPDVLLLDEPCAGLDEAAEARITEILVGLPHAMIVVSHDRAFLDGVTHETVRLQDGAFRAST